MKQNSFVALCSMLLLITSCSKDKVQQNTSGKSNLKVFSQNISGVSLYNGIPRYASTDAFRVIYEQLSASYMENLQSIEQAYYKENLSDDEYQELAWQVWDKTQEPLINFENSISLSSYRGRFDASYKEWLQLQGDNLDETSFPKLLTVDPIQKSMMNADGNFIIGDNVYHLLQSSDNQMLVIKILQLDDNAFVDYLNSIPIQPLAVTISSLQDWRNNHVSLFEIGGSEPSEPDGCRADLVSQDWVQIDNNTKYLAQHAFYYDLLKTSAIFQIYAFAKIKIVFVSVWVPALTHVRAGMQRFDYSWNGNTKNCEDKQSVYLDGTTIWGPINICQNNNWTSNRKIHRPLPSAPAPGPPTDGLWGKGWVKDMNGYHWTNLHW